MVVTKKMTVDLARKTIVTEVDAVQGDSAIALEMTLLSDGAAWVVPGDASVIVRYGQGSACGTYDTLSDGTPAWTAKSNVLTVRLAPEVCGTAGKTELQVTILRGNSQISTFRMSVNVQGELSGSDVPGEYTNLAQWLYANGKDSQLAVNMELQDLRIATDGTVYETAGEAVRQQLRSLKAEIAEVSGITEEAVQAMINASVASVPNAEAVQAMIDQSIAAIPCAEEATF